MADYNLNRKDYRRARYADRINLVFLVLLITFTFVSGATAIVYGAKPDLLSGIINKSKSQTAVIGQVFIPEEEVSKEEVVYDYDGPSPRELLESGEEFSPLDMRDSHQIDGLYLRGLVHMDKIEGLLGGIHMPIYEGASQTVLTYGAGIGEPDRVMGRLGDLLPVYAHNMADYDYNPSFFSVMQRMDQVDPIGRKIYTTDGEKIYTWITDVFKMPVPYTEGQITDNEYAFEEEKYTTEERARIMLITCYADASFFRSYTPDNRIILGGYLEDSVPINRASKELIARFPELGEVHARPEKKEEEAEAEKKTEKKFVISDQRTPFEKVVVFVSRHWLKLLIGQILILVNLKLVEILLRRV